MSKSKFYIVFNDDGSLLTRLPIDADVEDPLPENISSVDEELWLRTIQENDGLWWRDKSGNIAKFPYPPPTKEQVIAANTSRQKQLMDAASSAMTPLLLSLQLGDATEEETRQAKAWQTYTRALKAVDLTANSPKWPDVPSF